MSDCTVQGLVCCIPQFVATSWGSEQECTTNARVHFFARPVRFTGRLTGQEAEAAKLDAAIEVNLKELGYGG